jgi:hypothetical protein
VAERKNEDPPEGAPDNAGDDDIATFERKLEEAES